ncbi:GIY-YIG nuclease family protein [Enterococcus sp. AZ072]|uniref:GIY-YIG nuclease family protein n=1 Tax=unclassified Enterococcus TaxID=2608891 RepID=UPI003D2ABEE7
MLTLKEKVKQLPETPGIYYMKNVKNQVIYVGKAKNLNRRVSSYFVNSKAHANKTKQMIRLIDHFDFQLVNTEFDALILECETIHRLRPPFNRLMNHYEEYGYFQFLNESPFFKVLDDWSDQGFVIGPFYRKSKMLEFKNTMNSVYHLEGPLRYAKGVVADYQNIPPEKEFLLRLEEIKQTLLGRSTNVLTRIEERVEAASARKDFEAAQRWWSNYLLIERFLRRNRQLLQATNNSVFVGILSENKKYYCYLYVKGQLISRAVYQRKPQPDQVYRRLIKQVSAKNWRSLQEKKYLCKQDVDLFPIFFIYLNRNGQIIRFSWPEL